MTDGQDRERTADEVIAAGERGAGLSGDPLTMEELALVANLPINVVASAASVEVEDGAGTMAEILVGIRGIINGAERYPDNGLIAAAFAAYKAEGGGEERLLAIVEDTPPGLPGTTLDQSREAASRLAVRPEWSEFAGWIRGLAVGVVQASTKGGLLGIGGERVTQTESRFVSELTAALGAPTP